MPVSNGRIRPKADGGDRQKSAKQTVDTMLVTPYCALDSSLFSSLKYVAFANTAAKPIKELLMSRERYQEQIAQKNFPLLLSN